MNYPKANWPTVNNIAKSLMAVESFYIQTCNLMKSLLLPLPFVPDKPQQDLTPKPSYVYHTILEFVCSRVFQILENDTLSHLSLSAISELLQYFKDKQIQEYKQNLKITQKAEKTTLLQKLAIAEYKIATLSELTKENAKITKYLEGAKRKNMQSFDPGPEKKLKKFEVEEPKTEYCETDMSTYKVYESPERVKKYEIKAKCLPLNDIPKNLLAKCKNEEPSSSLFLFNLPKKISENEIFELLAGVLGEENAKKEKVKVDILKGRLKGQGFVHLDTVEEAVEVRDTLFGFPLQGKPMIVQYSTSEKSTHNNLDTV